MASVIVALTHSYAPPRGRHELDGHRAVRVYPHDVAGLNRGPGRRLRARLARIFISWSVRHAKERLPYQATLTTPSAPSKSPFNVGPSRGGSRPYCWGGSLV